MDVCRTIVSALSFFDPEEKVNTKEANYNKSQRLFSQTGMIVASYDRIRKGLPLIEPDRSLSYAGNFLLMLNGVRPSETAIRALDTSLILTADHEWNASTFAARVTAATLSDMHSAVTSGIGALKGPLHGGANEAVMKLLETINERGADPVEYVKGMIAQKIKIPGFGHRVYTTEDPRATHLRQMSRDLGYSSGKPKWYDDSKAIEEYINSEKKLNANVDFYSASVYHMLGIDVDLFTPLFVMSRMSGWTAHVMEQLADNRLIRPRAEYIGPAYPSKWIPMDQRG
jgi:citrate synthase